MNMRTLFFSWTTIAALGSASVQANIIDYAGDGSANSVEVTTVDMSGGYVMADGSILPGTQTNGALFYDAGVTVYRVWVHVDNALGMVAFAGGSVVNSLDLILRSSNGSFVNSPYGSDGPPIAGAMGFPGFESLLWDSFVTIGGATNTTLPGGFTIFDPGNTLGGLTGNIQAQNVGWFHTPAAGAGVVSDGAGGWRVLLAQLVVPAGEWIGARMRIAGGGDDVYFGTLGMPDVPSPPTIIALGLFAISGLTGKRRR